MQAKQIDLVGKRVKVSAGTEGEWRTGKFEKSDARKARGQRPAGCCATQYFLPVIFCARSFAASSYAFFEALTPRIALRENRNAHSSSATTTARTRPTGFALRGTSLSLTSTSSGSSKFSRAPRWRSPSPNQPRRSSSSRSLLQSRRTTAPRRLRRRRLSPPPVTARAPLLRTLRSLPSQRRLRSLCRSPAHRRVTAARSHASSLLRNTAVVA